MLPRYVLCRAGREKLNKTVGAALKTGLRLQWRRWLGGDNRPFGRCPYGDADARSGRGQQRRRIKTWCAWLGKGGDGYNAAHAIAADRTVRCRCVFIHSANIRACNKCVDSAHCQPPLLSLLLLR